MAVTLNASTSSGFIQTADTSGSLVLQSNGTTQLTVDSTGVYGQVERGTAVASTSGTSVDFTGLPSWVKRITVMLNGVSTNSTSGLQIQLGTSSGVEATSYSVNTAIVRGTYVGVAGAATATTGFVLQIAVVNAADTVSGHLTLTNISGNIWIGSGIVGAGTAENTFMIAGTKTTAATLDRVRITTVTGTPTFDAGSINILYEG
jgi:hypothetical protein